jgi:hypothetical protein
MAKMKVRKPPHIQGVTFIAGVAIMGTRGAEERDGIV